MAPRTAYELSESQVTTPESVVALFWKLARRHRDSFGAVLDMGAGDCRFGHGAPVRRYVGVEIDRKRASVACPPKNGTLLTGCVFKHTGDSYDACIGNPPYVRHHDIQTSWKDRTVGHIERVLGVSLNQHCNLYIYFLCLGLMKTTDDGLLALIIPYEWVSRPSVRAVRDFIHEKRWNVSVYRFQMPIFEGVMTTASITIIDKAARGRRWSYYDITPEFTILSKRTITGGRSRVLEYAKRGAVWALRGLSPGSQKIFTLTEGQRIHYGLSARDVVPCITTLRHVPSDLRTLSQASFHKYYVQAGAKCWLIKSFRKNISTALSAYLNSVPASSRQTYTCKNQDPWFNFRPHPVPQLLFSSGFTEYGPKVLLNSVGARTVGSVWGIHSSRKLRKRRLQDFLLSINFEKRVVGHARKLKKIEVRQLNGVLTAFAEQDIGNGRKRS